MLELTIMRFYAEKANINKGVTSTMETDGFAFT
jgi:hypothetical protein